MELSPYSSWAASDLQGIANRVDNHDNTLLIAIADKAYALPDVNISNGDSEINTDRILIFGIIVDKTLASGKPSTDVILKALRFDNKFESMFPTFTPKTLIKIAQSISNPEVQMAVYFHPQADATVRAAVNHDVILKSIKANKETALACAKSPRTGAELLTKLAKTDDPVILLAVVNNPKSPDYVLSDVYWHARTNDEVLSALAQAPAVSDKTLESIVDITFNKDILSLIQNRPDSGHEYVKEKARQKMEK